MIKPAGPRGLLLTLLLLATAAHGATAQLPMGAGGVSEEPSAHAWLLFPGPDAPSSVLLHVPPREGEERDGVSQPGADAGTVRPVETLRSVPTEIAAVDDSVYLVFGPREGSERAASRRVLSMRARPGAVAGYWDHQPRGRLTPHPSLPADAPLLGFTGSVHGPVAHLGASEDQGERLLLLHGGAWRAIGLPSADLSESAVLVRGGHTPQIVRRAADGEAEVWSLEHADDPSDWEGTGAWSRRSLPDDPAFVEADRIIALGDQLVYSRRDGAALEIRARSPDAALVVARLDDVPEAYALLGLRTSTGRVLVAWSVERGDDGQQDAPTGTSAPGTRIELREISAATGEVLHAGPPERVAPISAREFRLLAAILVAMMAMVLLVVLRPEPAGGVVALPSGLALAEPGRRLLATLIDALLAAIVVGSVYQVSPFELLSLTLLFRPDDAWVALPSMLAFGAIHGTLGEWLGGRTLGKLMTGCRVVQLLRLSDTGETRVSPRTKRVEVPGSGGVGRVRFGSALIRNAIKWFLPPVAALGLVDPTGRHRGDSIAGVAVVVEVEAGQEDRDDGGRGSDG